MIQTHTKPTFLFAFANDPNAPLPKLLEEERKIKKIFGAFHNKGIIELSTLTYATSDIVFQEFFQRHNRIELFHFAGHSSYDLLSLRDAKARAFSLKTLIKYQDKLQLVFLNGCSNKGLVKELLEGGVKAVIATSDVVEDEKAFLFSSSFYEAFVSDIDGMCLQKAFDEAAVAINTKYSSIEPVLIKHNRGEINLDNRDAITWKLFANEDADLEWKFPMPKKINDLDSISPNYKLSDRKSINKKLVKAILDGMLKFGYDEIDQDDQDFWNQYKTQDFDSIRFHKLQKKIRDTFPSVLALFIRDLFSTTKKALARVRLKKIKDTYYTLIQYLTATSLSCLWDVIIELKDKSTFIVRPEYKILLQDIFKLNGSGSNNCDRMLLLYTIHSILTEILAEVYISELKNALSLITSDKQFLHAHRFLGSILWNRLEAQQPIYDFELDELCDKAEESLGILLNRFAFLCNYQLITISEIEVYNPKGIKDEPDFIHQNMVMKGADESFLDDESLKLRYPIAHRSIVLLKINSREHLNLSPFFIDKSAFKSRTKRAQAPIPYFLTGFHQKVLHYTFVTDTDEPIIVIEQQDDQSATLQGEEWYIDLDILVQQIEAFKNDLNLSQDDDKN